MPPDSGEVLYFVMIEMDFSNIQELTRVAKLELSGAIDKEGLKQFVQAGGYYCDGVPLFASS